MKVYHKKLPNLKKPVVATIGVFDGIHLGHTFILKEVKKEAKSRRISSLAITFDILPQQFLHKFSLENKWKPRKTFLGCITDRQQKKALIKSLGFNYLWLLKTNRKLLELPGNEFIAFISKHFNIQKLIVGSDFCFGYGGRDCVGSLKRLAKQHGFEVSVIKKKTKSKEIISSTHIRKLIKQGDFKAVKSFLGRNFSLSGKVCRGKGLGRELGFPTANIYVKNYTQPAEGVYSVLVKLEKKIYLGAVYIGERDEGLNKPILIETHIIGFNKSILNKKITIFFLEKLRNKKKFRSLSPLIKNIQKDIKTITSKCSTLTCQHTQPLVP